MNQYIVMALLGLAGAFVNAATRLSAIAFADEEVTPRQLARAWTQFWVSIFFGPVAAVAFVPWLSEVFPHIKSAPLAVATGLAANVLWPIFVEGIVPALRKALGEWLTMLATAVTGQRGDGK